MILRRPRASSSSAQRDTNFNGSAPTEDSINIEIKGTSKSVSYNRTGTDPHRNNVASSSLPSSSFFLQRFRRLLAATQKKRRSASLIIVIIFLFAMTILSILILFLLQLHAFVREYQGPLDHVTTSLWEPYYGMFCPVFSFDDAAENYTDINSTSTTADSSTTLSWDCNDITIPQNDNAGSKIQPNEQPNFPRMFMIGARDEDEDTFLSWKQQFLLPSSEAVSDVVKSQSRFLPHLERINTLKMSNQYALSGGALRGATNINANLNNSTSSKNPNQTKQYLCRKMKWEQRLFAVYQKVFSNLLKTYPNDSGLVIVEDDATLKNPNGFVQEVCNAHKEQLGFYSLYRSPLQWNGRRIPSTSTSSSSSCVYMHGTVAFYIRRSIMERVINEKRRGSFCRFPIDMYISKMGPWYATRREIVGHLGSGRIGSTT